MLCETDAVLVESALGGDLESFGELCRRYYAPITAIAYSILADKHLAEDAAQEAFARALTSLGSLRRAARFGPWLASIGRNVAMDMVKDRTRYRDSAELWELPDRDSPDAIHLAVRCAVAGLPAAARELVVLRYYDNLSYDRITAVLGLSRSSINGRLRRTKRMLARALAREGLPEAHS